MAYELRDTIRPFVGLGFQERVPITSLGGGCLMKSNGKEPKPKMSLELDQEKPPKKKSLWQKIKEFFTNGLKKRISGEGKDWGDW